MALSDLPTLFDRLPAEWQTPGFVTQRGTLLRVTKGKARLHVNLREWELSAGCVANLFPADSLWVDDATPDFAFQGLEVSPEMLREASLQVENSVYEVLRRDCCICRKEVAALADNLLSTLRIYQRLTDGEHWDNLVLLQLKAFFLGAHDHFAALKRRGVRLEGEEVGQHPLFSRFMHLLSRDYHRRHDVGYYARLLAVTPKHLTVVCNETCGISSKAVIDQYLVAHLKMALLHTTLSVKEIAFNHHFPSLSHFCQYFKQRVGLSPQQFRHRMNDRP